MGGKFHASFFSDSSDAASHHNDTTKDPSAFSFEQHPTVIMKGKAVLSEKQKQKMARDRLPPQLLYELHPTNTTMSSSSSSSPSRTNLLRKKGLRDTKRSKPTSSGAVGSGSTRVVYHPDSMVNAVLTTAYQQASKEQETAVQSTFDAIDLKEGVTLSVGGKVKTGKAVKSQASSKKGQSVAREAERAKQASSSSNVSFFDLLKQLQASKERKITRENPGMRRSVEKGVDRAKGGRKTGSIIFQEDSNNEEELTPPSSSAPSSSWSRLAGGKPNTNTYSIPFPFNQEANEEKHLDSSFSLEHKPRKQPSLSPSKPSPSDILSTSLMTGGLHLKNPRDRVHPFARITPQEASRLPPPPLGEVTGHGALEKKKRKKQQQHQHHQGRNTILNRTAQEDRSSFDGFDRDEKSITLPPIALQH
jgi:hypothetical protein